MSEFSPFEKGAPPVLRNHQRKGIGVREILIVMVVITILATIHAPNIFILEDKGKQKFCLNEMLAIENGWSQFQRDIGRRDVFPHNNDTAFTALIKQPLATDTFYSLTTAGAGAVSGTPLSAGEVALWRGPYVQFDDKRITTAGVTKKILDPWGNPFECRVVLKSDVGGGQVWGFFILSRGQDGVVDATTSNLRKNLLWQSSPPPDYAENMKTWVK